MALNQLRLTNTTDGYSYLVYPIRGVTEPQTKSAFSISLPGQAPTDNILLGVSGMERTVQLQAHVWDDGTDRAEGTAPAGDFTNDTVTTLVEQKRWLQEYIQAPSFSVAWEIDTVTGPAAFDTLEVFVERVEVQPLQQDSPKWWPLRIDMIVGGSV